MECDRAAQSIYLIDKINTKDLGYKSLAAISQPTEMPIPDDLLRVLEGESVPIETITLHDGRSFLESWKERQERIISGQTNVSRSIDWTEFDQKTLQWYSKILKARANLDTLTARGINIDWNSSTDTIRQILLDGRGEITPEELHQLTLLFGNSQNLRRKIGRDILDLRARSTPDVRWDMREEITENLLQALQKTITFITQHNPIEGLSTNNLQASTGYYIIPLTLPLIIKP